MNTKKKELDKNQLYILIGRRLKIIRHDNGYTQEYMADILEITTAYYGKVERGIFGLSLAKLVVLNQKLNVDLTFLLTGIRQPKIYLEEIVDSISAEKRYQMEKLIECATGLANM